MQYSYGIFAKVKGNFGFIKCEDGREMFVLPVSCTQYFGGLPDVGTPLKFDVVQDNRTGRPRAGTVMPDLRAISAQLAQAAASGAAVPQQQDIFAWSKQHLLGDKDLENLSGQSRQQAAWETSDAPADGGGGGGLTGTMVKAMSGSFGFIQQDCDGKQMFVLPQCCLGFGSELPPIGTRVRYAVAADPKTGKPRAENVQPIDSTDPSLGQNSGGLQSSWSEPASGPESWSQSAGDGLNSWSQGGPGGGTDLAAPLQIGTGTFSKNKGKYGFINQDSGDPEMFVLPDVCDGFDKQLPHIGDRCEYDIAPDPKTGRPRAQNVRPGPAYVRGQFGPASRPEGARYNPMQ